MCGVYLYVTLPASQLCLVIYILLRYLLCISIRTAYLTSQHLHVDGHIFEFLFLISVTPQSSIHSPVSVMLMFDASTLSSDRAASANWYGVRGG